MIIAASVNSWAQLIIAIATLLGVLGALRKQSSTHAEVREINQAVNDRAPGEPTLSATVSDIAAKVEGSDGIASRK